MSRILELDSCPLFCICVALFSVLFWLHKSFLFILSVFGCLYIFYVTAIIIFGSSHSPLLDTADYDEAILFSVTILSIQPKIFWMASPINDCGIQLCLFGGMQLLNESLEGDSNHQCPFLDFFGLAFTHFNTQPELHSKDQGDIVGWVVIPVRQIWSHEFFYCLLKILLPNELASGPEHITALV